MKRKALIITSIILLLASLVIALIIIRENSISRPQELTISDVTNTAPAAETEQYVSPIDFDKLQNEYPDIVAWIDIPGPEISYPVFCNEDDDTFYITHNRDGKETRTGEIFIEHNYNKSDFSDPMTVIYGHNMKNETMFGLLENYFSYSDGSDDINGEITIYTKSAEYRCKVFAVTSYDNRHILYNYDFKIEDIANKFFDEIKNYGSQGTYFDDGIFSECNGNKIILSTCKNGNLNDRFLVVAGLYKTIDK